MDEFLYDEFYTIERTHWWAVGMRGIFHMLLGGAMKSVPDPLMLDVGCGTGITVEEFQRHGSICGLDLAWQAVTYTKLRVPGMAVVQGSLASLPIASRSLDAVLAFDVIEHLEDDRVGLNEILRVLKPGGVVLLNVPAFQSLWSDKDVANHHFRRYTRPMLRRVVEACGFHVERLTYTNSALFPAIWCARQIQRLGDRRWDSEAEYHPSAWINRPLVLLMRLEQAILRHADLPFGTSVTCVARKPN